MLPPSSGASVAFTGPVGVLGAVGGLTWAATGVAEVAASGFGGAVWGMGALVRYGIGDAAASPDGGPPQVEGLWDNDASNEVFVENVPAGGLSGGETIQALCSASLPRDQDDSYLNPSLTDPMRRLVRSWQLVKVTRRIPTKTGYKGEVCLAVDAASGATIEDIFAGKDKVIDLFKTGAKIDFRGVLLPTNMQGEVAMTVKDPENYAYVWLPKTASVVPPALRSHDIVARIVESFDKTDEGTLAKLGKAREAAKGIDVSPDLERTYYQSLYRDLVSAVLKAQIFSHHDKEGAPLCQEPRSCGSWGPRFGHRRSLGQERVGLDGPLCHSLSVCSFCRGFERKEF